LIELQLDKKVEEEKEKFINRIEEIKRHNKEKISTFFKDIIRIEKINKLK